MNKNNLIKITYKGNVGICSKDDHKRKAFFKE